jgi:hypothetical protein
MGLSTRAPKTPRTASRERPGARPFSDCRLLIIFTLRLSLSSPDEYFGICSGFQFSLLKPYNDSNKYAQDQVIFGIGESWFFPVVPFLFKGLCENRNCER